MINYFNRYNFFYLFLILSSVAEYKFINTSLIPNLIAISFLILNYKKVFLKRSLVIFIIIFLFYFLFSFFISLEKIIFVKNFKYFFAFILIYLYLNTLNVKKFNIFFFRLSCAVVLLECISINTFLDQEILYINPSKAFFFDFYQRPPSIVGTPSLTANFLVLLFYYFYIYKRNDLLFIDYLLLFLSLLLLFSLTGFLLLFFLFLIFFLNNKSKNSVDWAYFLILLIFSLSLISILIFLEKNYLTEFFNFQKISPSYLIKILSSHYNDFLVYIDSPISYNYIFGSQVIGQLNTSGHNGFLLLLKATGIYGFILFFTFIIIALKDKKNFLSLIAIVLLSCFHYYGLGNILIQIIIAKLFIENDK